MIKASLKNGFEVVRKSFPLASLLIAYNIISVLFTTFAISNPAQSGQNFASLHPLTLAIFGVMSLIFFYTSAGTIGYVRDIIKLGQPRLSTFFSSGCKYFFRILCLYLAFFLLFMAIIAILSFVFFVIYFLAGLTTQNAAPTPWTTLIAVLFGALLGIVGICLTFCMLYAPTIVVVDESKVFAAIKRSTTTVCRSMRKAFALAGLLLLFSFILWGLTTLSGTLISEPPLQVASVVIIGGLGGVVPIYLSAVIMSVYLRLQGQ